MSHLRNSPEGVFGSRKQTVGWKSALSVQSGKTCSVLWMYMLCLQPGEVTIHRLLPGSFLWPCGCRSATDSKASYSSRWLLPPPHLAALPPNDDGKQLLWWCFEFLCDVNFLWQRNRKQKRGLFGWDGLVYSTTPDMMSEECHSFLIWVMLIRLCTVGSLSCHYR